MIRTIAAAGLLAVASVSIGTATASATAPEPVATPVASVQENQAAERAFLTEFGIATSVGGFGGTVIGAGVGCLIAGTPAVVGGPLVIPACLAGAASGAAVGAVIGTIAVGGPTLAVAGADLVSTLTAAPGATRWADR
ncbi:hypothetical protein NONO_c61030 [Nocardia nova SH22a]|uniref:Uncharacterized protein n=1 Tax=Nocardia nova SH22a TaxID=1415166 RepID=W5TP29_9NOCA|nr:hypothetical protein [Nocardia nova]AHH20879.1 hypothetical protein NONO_c61030 [Nocardia nova SH22a]